MPRPRVAIVPTGDELVEPGQTPGPGQIRNSNAVHAPGAGDSRQARAPTVLPIAPDEPAPLRQILERGLEADVLVITGGVSAGQRDLVPAALEALGVDVRFPQGPAQAGQAALVRGRAAAGRPPRGARLRAAGQSGERPRRLPAVRQAGPGGRWPASRSRGTGWMRRRGSRADSRSAAIGRPIFPSRVVDPAADAAEPADRSRPLTGRGRPICGPRRAPTGSPSFAAGDRDYAPR